MPDLFRIKQNVSKMVSAGAPEQEIDSYISMEGTTANAIKNVRINPQFTKIAESPDVQRMAYLLRTMPFYRRGAVLMSGKSLEEIDRTLNAIPEPANTFGNALFKALPDIAMASPVLKSAGAIPKIWPVAKTVLGLGAYSGARAAGQNQPVLPAVVQGAAFGALGHGLGRAVTTVLPKIPLRGNIGSAAGWGATGAVLSPPEDRMQSAIFGAGMGALSPSRPLGKTKGQYLGEAINEYRTILRPTQSEIKNVEIRKGKNINDYYKLAAEEQLPLKQSADKKLDTVMAREKLEPKQSAIHEKLNEQLQANPAKQFDLFEIGRKAKTELRQSIKNDTEYIDAAKDVNKFILDAVKFRGRYLSGQQLNDFKQGMWATSYNQLQPNTQGTARKIGFIAKESIENAYPKSSIRELNELSGKYATLDILLQKAHGRVVSGGQIGRRFAETTGALAGLKIPFVGPIGGRYAGGKVSDYLYAPERASKIASKKAQKAGIVGESFRRTMGQVYGNDPMRTVPIQRTPIGLPYQGGQQALPYLGRAPYKPTGYPGGVPPQKPLITPYEPGGPVIRGQLPPRQSPQGKSLTAAEAVKQGMGAQGQNPLRNESGQAFIGGGQEVSHPSRIYKVLVQNPQETWSPQQLRGFLSGKVSKNELDTLLTPELMAKPKITKADVLQSIEKNMPQVEVVRKSEKATEVLNEYNKYAQSLIDKYQKQHPGYNLSSLVQDNILTKAELTQLDSLNNAIKTHRSESSKFSQWQLPGGSNYQETLIKAPSRKWEGSQTEEPKFQSSHFDEPNVLAHIRHNDRVTMQGEKVRFLEEVQSDWATQRRKHLEIAAEEGLELTEDIIPSHPLLKNWQELTLKQALKDAAESDAKYLSWTTGEQQAGRYDLSKQIDKIGWEKKSNGKYDISVFKNDKNLTYDLKIPNNLEGKEIEQYIGKEPARKIVESTNAQGELGGQDLKIGGEWAKNLYDKQIPNILKKLTGQDVEMIKLGLGKKVLGVTKYEEKPVMAGQLQPAIRLTPELKTQIKSGKGRIAELFNVGMLGPTAATGIGLATALKATTAKGESGESLDPKYKQQIANAENYRETTGDWAQLEDIALRDLKRIGKLKQNVTLKQVKADPQLYDKVVKLYWDRLDAFGIPEKDKALWWLMPGRYRQTGGDISRLKNPEHRNIMWNRVKNIGGRK